MRFFVVILTPSIVHGRKNVISLQFRKKNNTKGKITLSISGDNNFISEDGFHLVVELLLNSTEQKSKRQPSYSRLVTTAI